MEREGLTPEEVALKAFYDMEFAADKSPETSQTFKEVKAAITRYAEAREGHESSESSFNDIRRNGEREEVVEARNRASLSAQTRNAAHLALISALERLEKGCNEKGISTGWRGKIGTARNVIGLWAEHVAPYVRD